MDAQGYIRITGRLKDLIIRGGENIQPLEVENCILAHPGVLDVSVVGVKDERYGEVVGAFVIRAEGDKERAKGEEVGEKEIREWVKGRMSGHLGSLDASYLLLMGSYLMLRFCLCLQLIVR